MEEKPKPAKPRTDKEKDEERLDEAISESFPASDAPSWTGGTDPEADKPGA